MKGVCGELRYITASVMYKLKAVKKILSIMTCSVIALAAAAVYPANDNSGSRTASAITIDEIQQEREANQAKIEEYQNQINSLEGSKESEEQYQKTLEHNKQIHDDQMKRGERRWQK